MQNLWSLLRFPCKELNPSIGTLVEPVQNLKKIRSSSDFRILRTSQNSSIVYFRKRNTG